MIKYFIFFILAGYILLSIIIFGVDFYFFLVERYCRFHIGRWKNQSSWEAAVYRIVVKWSKKTPTVKITDNSRYILLDMLKGKYRSMSIQSWQNAAVILGLLEKKDYYNANKSISRFIDNNGNWRKSPITVDSSVLAYAILKASKDVYSVKPAMDFMIALVEKNVDDKGLISYTGGKYNAERYVDTLGLVCPFLALYAKVYEKPEYEQLAYEQLAFYHEYGLFKDTYLPNHAVNAESKLPLGVYGWGRGTAWYILGLIDTFLEVQNKSHKEHIGKWIREAAESYKIYQCADGGFGSILQMNTTYDSSATAALAYFYFSCAALFENKEYETVGQRCLQKLKTVTRINGKIDWCQGDTKGIGIFAQTYDIMPFAQGFALRAIEVGKRIVK